MSVLFEMLRLYAKEGGENLKGQETFASPTKRNLNALKLSSGLCKERKSTKLHCAGGNSL